MAMTEAIAPLTQEELDGLLLDATPGPWVAEHGPQGGYVISDTENGFGLCQRSSWPHRAAESRANGNLIASVHRIAATAKHLNDEAAHWHKSFETAEVRAWSAEARVRVLEKALEPFAHVPYGAGNTFNRAALADDDFRCARRALTPGDES